MATSDFDIQVIKAIEHPLYIEKFEKWRMPGLAPDEPPTQMHSGYNINGDYIGDIKTTKFLCEKKGIAPEKSAPDDSVCSIGYCAKDNKWYGWSHRAIVGFGIGDKIFEENFGDDKTPFIAHGAKPITDLSEAKLAAQRFAQSVASTQELIAASTVLPEWYHAEQKIHGV